MALVYIPLCAFVGWILGIAAMIAFDEDSLLWKIPALGAIIGVFLCGWNVYYDTTPEGIAYAAAERAQEQADLQPRVIREFDGCKVYAFKGGGQWHYITRCPDRTVTERNYTEQHGKITEHKTETTTTENH